MKKKKQKRLTGNQAAFINALISGLSQREAYKKAYNCTNAKDKSIDEKASRLLKEDHVWAKYTELLNQVRQQAEENAVISGERVVEELAAIAFSDIKNYLEYVPDETKPGRYLYRIKDISNEDTRAILTIKYDKAGNGMPILHSKIQALTKLLELYHPEIMHDDAGVKIMFEESEGYDE